MLSAYSLVKAGKVVILLLQGAKIVFKVNHEQLQLSDFGVVFVIDFAPHKQQQHEAHGMEERSHVLGCSSS